MNDLAFYKLVRWNVYIWKAKVRSLENQSTLLLSVIWLFILAYWVFGFQLFYEGLQYVKSVPVIGPGLLQQLLYLFFAFLLMMLFFSNVIIGYATIFRNQETQWLLSLPVSHADILRWKWLETMLLASWAFLFLSGPLLLAYGMVQQSPLTFYAKAVLLYAPFLVIPSVLAAGVTLLIARYIPPRAFKIALLALAIGSLVVLVWVLSTTPPLPISEPQLTARFDGIMSKTMFASSRLLPSDWLVEALLADFTRDQLFFYGVLLSNALVLGLWIFSAKGSLFFSAWSQVQGRAGDRLKSLQSAAQWTLKAFSTLLRCVPGLPPPMRAIVLKDVRTFLRDTVQWSQFAIFFGILGMYVLNLRHVTDGMSMPGWSYLVSFLNLVACAMTLATLTTRFVFPQFSLEGKRLWVVGLAPVGLRRVLREKFWLSSVAGVTITVSLMLISSLMLRLDAMLVVLFCATVGLMGIGLSGLAVGLGALYPNFKEDNPSKIVSGFGGTFCLVLSMTYVTGCVGIEVLGLRLYLRRIVEPTITNIDPWVFVTSATPAFLAVALLTVLVAWLPMELAERRIDHLEI